MTPLLCYAGIAEALRHIAAAGLFAAAGFRYAAVRQRAAATPLMPADAMLLPPFRLMKLDAEASVSSASFAVQNAEITPEPPSRTRPPGPFAISIFLRAPYDCHYAASPILLSCRADCFFALIFAPDAAHAHHRTISLPDCQSAFRSSLFSSP